MDPRLTSPNIPSGSRYRPLLLVVLVIGLLTPLAHAAPQPTKAPEATAISNNNVEAIRDIASRAIEASQHDLDVVKWLIAVIGGLLAAIAGIIGFTSFKTVNDIRDSFHKRIDEQVKAFTVARAALTTIMTFQIFLQSNFELFGQTTERRRQLKADIARSRSTELEHQLTVTKEELNAMTGRLLTDLRQVSTLLDDVDDATGRWKAWLEGWMALVLFKAERYPEAVRHFEEVCSLTSGTTAADRARLASHRYNFACCYAAMGKKQEALEQLELVLELAPWRYSQCKTDRDFESLWKDEKFEELTKAALARHVTSENGA